MILKYLKFLTKASNQHGVHSPFVYNLVTNCFYKKTAANLWNPYLKEKQQLDNKTNVPPAKNISTKKVKLLIRLVAYFKPKYILEINRSRNNASLVLNSGNKNASVITLESNQEFKVLKNQQFDFIYFNENHSKKDTLNFFKNCLNTLKNDAIWVFNDIYKNTEIQEAWIEIKNHQKVTVTVDVFYFGFVFFRKEQAKEHFKIRV